MIKKVIVFVHIFFKKCLSLVKIVIHFWALEKVRGKNSRKTGKVREFLEREKVGTLQLVLRICNRMRKEAAQNSEHNEY